MKPATEKNLLNCLLIILAIFIPYHQVAEHRFIEFDDGLYTYLNTYIIQGLTWDSIVWSFTNTESANWHPLTWISHLVDRELFGPHAGGYFLMNVAWHTLAACLCYFAFLRCTKRRLFALSVAIIFAIHPANVENVAWGSERKSLIDAAFWFAGIIAYLDFIETRERKFYGLVVITHLLGLMAKAMHVTFPCALVLIHLLHTLSMPDAQTFVLRDYLQAVKKSLKLVWPLLILSAYFSVVTASAQAKAMSNLDMLPVSGRLINVLLSYQEYVFMFFSPGRLAAFYPLFNSDLVPAKAIFPAIFLACTTLLLVFFCFKRRPVPLLGWLWFLGTMVPAVGLVQVGSQSHADRYLYIPMIGLCFVIPELFACLHSWTRKQIDALQAGWVVLAALALGIATYIQVGYWENGIILFRHSLEVTGDCVSAVNCLGCAYVRNERYADAIAFLDSKIRVAKNPENIARFYAFKGQAQLALSQYAAAVESANQAIAHGNKEAINGMILAHSYFQLGKMDLAKKAIATVKEQLGSPNRTLLGDDVNRQGILYLEKLVNAARPPSPVGQTQIK